MPDRLTVCGLVLALSVTLRVPVRVPRFDGVNTTEIAQLAFAANVLGDNGQVLDACAKSPEVEIPEIVSGTAWLFLTVTLFPALVVPITWLAKVRFAGVRLTGAVPVPLNGAVCGEFEALSLTVSVPVRAPTAVGVKVTETWQLSLAPSVLGDTGQVEVSAKSPDVEIPSMVRGTV